MYTLHANLDAVSAGVKITIDYPHPNIARRGGCGVGKILHNPRDIFANLRYIEMLDYRNHEKYGAGTLVGMKFDVI